MKKLILLFTSAACLLAFHSHTYASESIRIVVKGEEIRTDASPVVIGGHVLVPIRAVAVAMGATVAWDAKIRTASVSRWNETVSLTVGKKTSHVSWGYDDSDEPLEASAKLIGGRVFMPLRDLSQQLGYRVAWSKGVVSIDSWLSDADRATLYNGDLPSARKLLIKMAYDRIYYANKPLLATHAYENYSRTFIFPEGKALRFYMIDSDETVSVIEVKDDSLVATWQANLDYQTGGDSIPKLFADQLQNATGPKPKLGTTLHTTGPVCRATAIRKKAAESMRTGNTQSIMCIR